MVESNTEQAIVEPVAEAVEAIPEAPAQKPVSNPKFDDILNFLDKETRASKTLESFKGKPLDEALPQLVKNYVHAQSLTGKKVGLFSEDEIREFVDLPVKPKSADDYLNIVQDGDLELVDKFKDIMYDMGLDSQQASKFIAKQVIAMEEAKNVQGASIEEQSEQAENVLHEKFGLNYRKALDIVKQTALDLGGDALVSKILDAPVKDPQLIEMLYRVGKELGTGSLKAKEMPQAALNIDPAAERKKLLADPAFKEAYLNDRHADHKAAVEKMKVLYE